MIILKSRKTIEWTIDTSAMDGRVMVVVSYILLLLNVTCTQLTLPLDQGCGAN